MVILSREARIIWSRRIRGFWEEFRVKKIGMIGLGLLTAYVLVAIFAPWLSPHAPLMEARLADSFAMPEWMGIFPQFSNFPPTIENKLYWDIEKSSQFVDISWGTKVLTRFTAESKEVTEVELGSIFSYSNTPPRNFFLEFQWAVEEVRDVTFLLDVTLITSSGEGYKLWYYKDNIGARSGESLESVNYWIIKSLGFEPATDNLAEIIFSEPGEYTILFHITFTPTSPEAECTVLIENARLVILGMRHGFLGSDNMGGDVFSALVYGARVSLMIGLLSAISSTGIGIVAGVSSGYLGGIADEALMRIVDILLCLPLLPLLLTLVFLFGKSIFYIVLFIALFGWLGLSRIIRSQVLALREMTFIECAKAAGASKFYIMMKHLVPNILPIAFASLVLAVPSAILFEAALSFLGFGDPRIPTWGKMLHNAFGFGGFTELAWWWILPPGLAITFLCLSFVFLGHAVDEIVNPRLRRRR